MNNRFQHESKRLLRFEAAQVGDINANDQADTQVANRGYPRTETSNTLPDSLYPGQQMVVLAGGDSDYPITIGVSPWLL